MKLFLITICLDAMPFLPIQFSVFNRLRIPWTWLVAEGVADNVKDTDWCRKIPPRLSQDGTTEFLTSLRSHPRVKVFHRQLWNGKTEMVNFLLDQIKEPCVLLQVDADELWLPHQIEAIHQLVSVRFRSAYFYCRYFVGPNIITTGQDCFGANPGEWKRVWRFTPGQKFLRHEPPILDGECQMATRDQTRSEGLVFDHYAYAFEPQVRFKQLYYGYANAVDQWRNLQANRQWPVRRLRSFLDWVDEKAGADLLHSGRVD